MEEHKDTNADKQTHQTVLTNENDYLNLRVLACVFVCGR